MQVPPITHIKHNHQEPQTNTQTDYIQHQIHQTPNFNQSVVALLGYQKELAHSTQCLHQQTTDALHNITKSSALPKN